MIKHQFTLMEYNNTQRLVSTRPTPPYLPLAPRRTITSHKIRVVVEEA